MFLSEKQTKNNFEVAGNLSFIAGAHSQSKESPLAGKEMQDLGGVGLYCDKYGEEVNRLGPPKKCVFCIQKWTRALYASFLMVCKSHKRSKIEAHQK